MRIKHLFCLLLLVLVVFPSFAKTKAYTDDVDFGKFFGNKRGSYISPNSKLVDQMTDLLTVPPEVSQKINKDLTLYEGCMAHNCTEKGAYLIQKPNHIKAAAFLFTHCEKTDCDAYRTLTVFSKKTSPISVFERSIFEKWAKDTIQKEGDELLGPLRKIEFVQL